MSATDFAAVILYVGFVLGAVVGWYGRARWERRQRRRRAEKVMASLTREANDAITTVHREMAQILHGKGEK